jgi:hypothetical protein
MCEDAGEQRVRVACGAGLAQRVAVIDPGIDHDLRARKRRLLTSWSCDLQQAAMIAWWWKTSSPHVDYRLAHVKQDIQGLAHAA